jgi:hypothetical protein
MKSSGNQLILILPQQVGSRNTEFVGRRQERRDSVFYGVGDVPA